MPDASTGTIARRPMFLTVKKPVDIIGRHNMDMFTAHMRICYSETNGGEFPSKRLNKEIGPANREVVIRILNELRENGFVPAGINDNGNVGWSVITRPDYLDVFENEEYERLKKMSTEEVMRIGRGGWKPLMDRVSVDPVEGYQVNAEKVKEEMVYV